MANKLIESYLNMLNEGDNPQNSSMPNPYDYQSIELDPNVKKEDFNKLGQWLKQSKEMLDPDMPVDPYKWIYCGLDSDNNDNCIEREKSKTIPYTIIDKGKRVGIVAIVGWFQLKWSSWVSGHNYSLRGTMKMIEMLIQGNHPWSDFSKKWLNSTNMNITTTIHHKNIASLKIAMKLKMQCEKQGDYYKCKLKQPYWWFQKEENKHWWKR